MCSPDHPILIFSDLVSEADLEFALTCPSMNRARVRLDVIAVTVRPNLGSTFIHVSRSSLAFSKASSSDTDGRIEEKMYAGTIYIGLPQTL